MPLRKRRGSITATSAATSACFRPAVAAAGTGAKAVTGGGAPTITITVEGPWTKQKVQIATNTLAQLLITFANRYTTLKAKLISHRIAIEQAQIKTFTDAEAQAQKNIKTIDNSSALPLDKVAAESPFVSDLESAASQIGTLTDSLTNDEVSLVAAHDIESASFISRATGRRGQRRHAAPFADHRRDHRADRGHRARARVGVASHAAASRTGIDSFGWRRGPVPTGPISWIARPTSTSSTTRPTSSSSRTTSCWHSVRCG